mmetsp:Transcript_2846/g.8691  ORF Transcript_2846/g.8691 Transcript_2846/m.8691 type:complete len:336 (+) Transcript_2846:207-1214(+)|eukprot:CAMPEP_0198729038 /NCGR_PEP_ID=MMETSP1475-20131203/13922_1 /TAXON_ID= ORGANISM="Unidentified sp., Strain CCMP1999" /NCGR_SAMPLE_ID=MMETSP1475 /ASSEMBLY_ACC=CAM_ASM_001111 /LENGTH=335 /DNA_ID=CAMNT_0044491573 /DNA_START=59 /DNA_END=1066 /DNA_ORIENTATION=+
MALAAISHHGDPKLLGTATEGNATLIARPEALLKFAESQEQNPHAHRGQRREQLLEDANQQQAKQKKGGLLTRLFCAGSDSEEVRLEIPSEGGQDSVAETAPETFEIPWNKELHRYILSCIDVLESSGLTAKRPFAVSGSQMVIEKMKHKYDEPLPANTDLHVTCAVLKQAIRDAEIPLVEIEALQHWAFTVAAAKTRRGEVTEEEDDCLSQVPTFKSSHLYATLQIVEEKSPQRAYVLARLVYMLGDISARVEETQMNSHNLSLCLAPSLLQWDAYEDSALLVLGRMTAFVMNLIDDGRENPERLRDYYTELHSRLSSQQAAADFLAEDSIEDL